MRLTDAAVLTALRQADAFINAHLHQLGDLPSAGYRQKLTEAIAALERHALDQATAERMSDARVARQHALRAALRVNHMRPIAAIAAARLREIPELNGLRMPPFRARTLDLVIAAETMAEIARQHAPVFIASGLAPDFIEQLEASAELLRQCVTDRETSVTVRVAAAAGLRSEASHGRHVLRVLSSLIEPRIADNAALLAEWRTARHIRRPATPQPVVFPLVGLAVAQSNTASAPAAVMERPVDPIAPPLPQLALPTPGATDPLEQQRWSAASSPFGRAAQVFADDRESVSAR